MKIEHVAGIRLAPRGTAQQQRNFAIRRRVFGKIVVNAQRMPAGITEVFTSDRAARIRSARYCIGAGSEAVAATTIEYSMAPYSSSVFTTCATVERFCPIAT